MKNPLHFIPRYDQNQNVVQYIFKEESKVESVEEEDFEPVVVDEDEDNNSVEQIKDTNGWFVVKSSMKHLIRHRNSVEGYTSLNILVLRLNKIHFDAGYFANYYVNRLLSEIIQQEAKLTLQIKEKKQKTVIVDQFPILDQDFFANIIRTVTVCSKYSEINEQLNKMRSYFDTYRKEFYPPEYSIESRDNLTPAVENLAKEMETNAKNHLKGNFFKRYSSFIKVTLFEGNLSKDEMKNYRNYVKDKMSSTYNYHLRNLFRKEFQEDKETVEQT